MSFLNLMRNRLKPKEVNEALTEVEGRVLPVTSTATTGQILKLTGETKTPAWADEYSYTPPAYSTTETATGQKWIDGREIFSIVKEGTLPEITTLGAVTLFSFAGNSIIGSKGFVKLATGTIMLMNTTSAAGPISVYQASNKDIALYAGVSYSERPYKLVIEYVKDPTPGRAPEDSDPEPEPEEKKTTKKKGRT